MALGKGLNSLIPQGRFRKTIRKETSNVSDGDHNRIWHIPLSEISPNIEQPRKNFSHEELEDLVASIKKHGILQPITVTEKTDGGYELIAGERRLRSSQIAGLATIPAIVRIATAQEKLELALIENIQREDLNPIEEGFAYKRLIEEFNLTQQEVSEQIGKSRSTIANMVRLLDLPELIQKALIDKKISTGKARALLTLKDEGEQLKVFRSMIGEGFTVRDVEKEVYGEPVKSRKGSVRRDPNIAAQEELLEERLGTKVVIAQRGEKGAITIHFSSKGELKRLLQELT
ncbi:MAG: ParB/RepB/Spo0J family partition protein [bacterium]|nr:ParB/RepB/Spo0J family partition protein [bacterium]